jgi:hypothetical protein
MITALTQLIVKVHLFAHNPLPEGEGIGCQSLLPQPLALWERAVKKRLSIKIKLGEGS